MSNFAAHFLVAVALAAQGANAALQGDNPSFMCAAGYMAKVGADDKYCMMGSKSCSTDSTCCQHVLKSCATEATSITCDADAYNTMDTTPTGRTIDGGYKTPVAVDCCKKKATCATASCAGYMEKDTTKGDSEQCAGDPTSCSATCCKAKADLCYAWNLAGNACDAGFSIHTGAMAGTGSDKAACCTANVMCSTHTCPSATHELKAFAETTACTDGVCTNEMCCKCLSTTCCASTITCATNMYKDSDKNGVIFKVASTDCCTAQAQCKDSVTTAVSGAPVLSSSWPLLSAFSMLALVLGN